MMNMRLLSPAVALACASMFAVPALAKAPTPTEACGSTTWTALAASDCAGAFSGNINGDPSELAVLSTEFGGTWTYAGKSDDSSNGPFTSNPNGSTNVTLTFDSAMAAGQKFVIGLKAASNYSFYLFDPTSPVSSLTFSSTAGVATNNKGVPQDFSHANLYVAAIPEPETYAMLLAGLAAVGWLTRRRQQG